MTNPQLPGQITLSDYLDNLDEHVIESTDAPSLDDAKAAALLRKLGAVEKAISANEQTASRERNKITDWEQSVNSPLQNEAVYLRELLTGYAVHQRDSEDRKTISTPFGTLSTRPANPEWVITDKDEFIAWAKDSGIADLVRTKEEPALSVIKDALLALDGEAITPAGEPAPGLSIKQPAAPYTVSIKPRN